MCGIVGFVGKKHAAPVLIDGLYKLEYRGYDSAGIAVLANGGFQLVRRVGRVKEIECARELLGNVGIGHTRWATNGGVTEENAHPHICQNIALVHNGIIENAHLLREECLARGETFSSETDSEVIAHLIARAYQGDLLRAVREGCSRLKGSYALTVLCTDEPHVAVCVRMRSPLVVGRGKDGVHIASDIPAIAAKDMEIFSLADGEFARVEGAEISFFGSDFTQITKKPLEYDVGENALELKGYRHFMRKEIDEIPAVLEDFAQKFKENLQFSGIYRVLCQTEYIQIVACGTAFHSGLCAKEAIEQLSRIPVEVFVASEYRYRDPIVPPHTLMIAVSQSGETADTLAAAELAKERGAYVLAITNVEYSSITEVAHSVLYTRAGREVAVAATKSFNAQLMTLYSLAVLLAEIRGRRAPSLAGLSSLAALALERSEIVRSWTPRFAGASSVYFIGRGADHCAALEGSLKLKEISYLPSEGYAAGELKHGTLALIEQHTPVVAILTQRELAEKTMNAVHEAYARGASIFLVTCFAEYCDRSEVTASVLLPECEGVFSPVISVIPLQLLAYYTSIARGNDPDKPRNLAKSVTVE